MSDLGNFSMMELFREEVRTHTSTLGQGLLALEQDPQNIQNIEPLMRGAHSIKGASRIVQIEPAVQLAHAMESVFVAIQEGRIKVVPGDIDVLLKGTDILSDLCQLREEDVPAWCAKKQSDVDQLKNVLQEIEAGRSSSLISESIPTPQRDVRNQAPVETPSSPVHRRVFDIFREPLASNGDGSMLSVFREEVRVAALKLSEGMSPGDAHLPDSSHFDELIEATKSLRGAARIVSITQVAELGQTLHDILSVARDAKVALTASLVSKISDTLLLLAGLIPLDDADLPAWLKEHDADFAALNESLKLESAMRFQSSPTAQPSPTVMTPVTSATEAPLYPPDQVNERPHRPSLKKRSSGSRHKVSID